MPCFFAATVPQADILNLEPFHFNGTYWRDSSGNDNHLQLALPGVTVVPNGLEFSGNGAFQLSGSLTGFNPATQSTALTFVFWVKPDARTSPAHNVLCLGRPYSTGDVRPLNQICIRMGSMFDHQETGGFGFAEAGYPATALIPYNNRTWTMVSFVKNGTTGYLYINDQLVDTRTASIDAVYNAGPVFIGSDLREGGYLSYAGTLGVVQIWGGAKTAAEIQGIFRAFGPRYMAYIGKRNVIVM